MRLILLALLTAFSTSCRSMNEDANLSEERSNTFSKVTLCSSVDDEDVGRILWQRSYPSEYAKLIEEAESLRNGTGDPFAAPITTQNSDLTPGGFDWRMAIIPRTFEQLGWPLTNGAEAFYYHDTGVIEITHKPAAIKLFKERFPEFTPIKETTKQVVWGNPLGAPESKN